jgi:hypothetical protein
MFSRPQVLVLDGIRYSVEMGAIAYGRLLQQLDRIAAMPPGVLVVEDIAAAMMDAWTIIDSAHRLDDLLTELPGFNIKKHGWSRTMQANLAQACTLRDPWQHQRGEIRKTLATNGQIWGYLSWAEWKDERHTGQWLMISPGAVYKGDAWPFIGPASPGSAAPPRHVKLQAFGKSVYLGRIVEAMVAAASGLERGIEDGAVSRDRNAPPADGRRGADLCYSGYLEVLVSVAPQVGGALPPT